MRVIRLVIISTLLVLYAVFLTSGITIKEDKKTKSVIRKSKFINRNYTVKEDILLENNSNLPDIDDFFIYDGNFYFFSKKEMSLYKYNYKGKMIFEHFFEKGKGPGEFLSLSEIMIKDNFIYLLDRKKLTICKMNLNYKVIWEKRIPDEIVENGNVFSFKIALVGEYFIISRSVFTKNESTIYILDSNFKIVNKNLSFAEVEKERGFNDYYSYMNATGLRICDDNKYLYVGLLKGNNLIYSIDVEKNMINYKVVNKNYVHISPEIKKYDNGGVEILSYHYLESIKSTKNFIITFEETGGREKEKESNIPQIKNYYNNLSFYSKKGEYLFSLEDRNLPYNYYGYNYDVLEESDKLILFILMDNSKIREYSIVKEVINVKKK